MRFWLGVLTSLLVVSPSTVKVPYYVTQYETVVREVEVQPEWVETPIIDSMITDEEWAEMERQNACLWDYFQINDIEITYESVVAVGDYTDIMGGACYLMGVDDVPVE